MRTRKEVKSKLLSEPKQLTLRDYVEQNFYITDKNSAKVPLRFNSAQEILYKEIQDYLTNPKPTYILILKSRKIGCSTFIMAVFSMMCMLTNYFRAVTLSHEREATKKLLDKVRFFIKHMDIQPKMKYESREELYFEEQDSTYYIGAAGEKGFGRGDDIRAAHFSELDWWNCGKDKSPMTGVMEALVKNPIVFIETTGKGIGSKTYNLIIRILNGQSNFKFIFFPWMDDPDCYLDPPKEYTPSDEEAREMKKLNINVGQMYWKHEKLRTMEDPKLFPQEYPSNWLEAFLVRGSHYFDIAIIQAMIEHCPKPKIGCIERKENEDSIALSFKEDSRGKLEMYKLPEKGHRYIVAADPAEGKEIDGEGMLSSEDLTADDLKQKGSDNSVAVVIDRTTWETVAVMIGQIDPDTFGHMIVDLGYYYNSAIIGVERNNHGYTVLNILTKVEKYSNVYFEREEVKAAAEVKETPGWLSTKRTEPMINDFLRGCVKEQSCKIPSRRVLLEMLSFVETDGKRHGSEGSTDDCVRATAIGYWLVNKFPYIIKEKDAEVKSYGGDIHAFSQT